MNRAAFLDRDGVINRKARKGEYITRWEDLQILPGVATAIALLNQSDFRVIVVSNQRCVAKGQIGIADLEAMHRQMCDVLAASGATIDAIYYCPHEKQPVCECRKPAPGMLLAAARDHHIDLPSSWMIGDSDIDIEAGKNAGCKTVRLIGPGETCSGDADIVADSLPEAIGRILHPEAAADRAASQTCLSLS